MVSYEEALDDSDASTPPEDRHNGVGGPTTDPPGRNTRQEAPADAPARMLELAATTADQLVAGAQTEAESLVATAQAKADAILGASHHEAGRVAAELSRTRHEQHAELERERATALAGLADERAALEAQIAALRQMQSDHRNEMRRHLTQQLTLLDATMPEPPPGVAAG